MACVFKLIENEFHSFRRNIESNPDGPIKEERNDSKHFSGNDNSFDFRSGA
jgi:hypothetical protein